jgi:crotonobetainyl-CoA:carnitine CoA-transferase CaiB-like acyl-CoA transferase
MESLTGVRVIDLSRLLPGPYATQLLANLGAEVIKIERPPEGDYARAMPPYVSLRDEQFEGAVFAQNNQNKKSVAVDIDTPQGQEIVLRLCEQADVFVESFRPNALKRRGLDYDGVRARNDRIIYCALSGYGQSGPHAQRAGHDLNYLALAGVLKLNGARGESPLPMPVQVADLAGGMRAALEIAAALVERERTGKGKFLDVALFDAAVEWMLTIPGALYRAEGENPKRGEMPLAGAYPCYGVYETRDGEYISLGALEPIFWRAFCVHADCAGLMDYQFDTDAIARTAEVIRARTRAEWIEFSERVDCCMEPLLDVSEVAAHPQVVARGLMRTEGRVPRLGEDTAEVLGAFGIGGDAASSR